MIIKLDENFDARLVAVLDAEGHDTDIVSSEGLAGSDDETIYATRRSNGRVLITLDLDFSNPFRFPPEDTEGRRRPRHAASLLIPACRQRRLHRGIYCL